MNKEQIYDSEIAPLMAKIIATCQTHKIAMLCDFAIGHEDDEGLKCTTALLQDELNPPKEMLRALELLRPKQHSSVMMITATKPDGSKTLTAVLG